MAIDIYSIANELTHDIVNLDILPGSKIIEDDIASRFHISRSPVRQVIMCLEGRKLIEVRPKIGTFVTKIDVNSAKSQIYIRESVEKALVREIIEKSIPLDREFLKDNLCLQKYIISNPSTLESGKAFFHADNSFHKSLFCSAGKERVWQEIHSEALCFNRVRIMANMRDPVDVEKVYEEHVQLLDYIENKDVDGAILLMDRHIETGFEGLDKVKEKFPDYFIEERGKQK